MSFGSTIVAAVLGGPSTPVDSNATANGVVEGAAVNTLVGITASSSDPTGSAITYSLGADSSGGGFKINPTTGVVSVADSSKIDFETPPGHAYAITVLANDGYASSSQTFTIPVSDVAPSTPVDSNAGANTVAEGAAAGTTVGVTASSTDINGPAVTWSLTNDSSGGGFTINAATGVVTVADPTKIDYESSAPGHSYTVTAQASDGTQATSQTFTIAVSDVAIAAPVDANAATNSVAEGAANGTTVGLTASAIDPNGPATSYSLIGDSSGGGFTINATTGVVTVADATKIDYESSGAGHSYTVTVQAINGATTTSQIFTIGVSDVAPSAPVDSDNTTNIVAEGAANGSHVGITASSSDVNGPAVTWSLTGDSSGGGFTINANTGVVTVADQTKIDFETAAGHAYNITAQASDGTLTTSQVFAIAVSDVAPTAPVDSDGNANTVAEGAANGSTVGVTASSTDVNGPGVTYSLTGDTSGGGFTINSTTGVVTVADHTKIDFESTAPGHTYTVTATASDGTDTSSQNFTIGVSDVAPSVPVDSDGTTNTVAEGAANGSTVGVTASSTDVNSLASVVTYTLTANSSNGGFTINHTTGVVTVADATKIDYESSGAGHSYTVTAQASDGTLTNSQIFTIAVSDVPPSTPVDSDAGANQVAVSSPAGASVGVTASSTDVNGPNVTYSLVGDTSSGGFTIDPNTGKVTVADPSKIHIADSSYDIKVDSSDGTLHSQQTFNIAVVLDAAPVVTAGHTLNYTENQAATALDPAVTVTDSDNANLVSATVQITNYANGEDVLAFTNQNGIAGSFNAATGTLTLTGTSSVTHYQAALASVTYFNTSDNPSATPRTVTITANDGTLDSAPVTDTINVTPVNDPPVVVAGHTLNYTENQAATAFDAAIAVSDVDSSNLASATVQITGNYTNGQDILGFTNQNGITGSFNSGTGTLTLTGTSSVAHYQAALASVTYVNTSDNPSGLVRTVTIVTNDGSANSTAVTDTINVTPVNDAPVTSAGGTLNYTENQAATAIDSAVTVSDVDSANMASATVAITNFVSGQDVLGFTNQNGITGSFNSATGVLTLTGSASTANYKTALDSVTYFNSSDNPSGADRTVSYTVNDGALNSNISTSTIHVTPVNDAPTVSFGAITGFTEPPNGTPAANSVPVTIAPNLAINDVDSSNLTSATFVLNDLKPSDALSISGHAGTSGDISGIHFDITSTAGTETVTLTGTDTLAHYNAVLDLVQFNNTSENPDTTARSYTVTAVDDSGTATNTGSASTTETVTAVDDAPVAVADSATVISGVQSTVNLLTNDTDVDTAHASLTAVKDANPTNGSVVVNSDGTFTYTANAGFFGNDSFTYHANDGSLNSNVATVSITVNPNIAYINNQSTGLQDGSLAHPYQSIDAFNAANDAAHGYNVIYVEEGTGTYAATTSITLRAGQYLEGQGVDASYVSNGNTVVVQDFNNTSTPTISITGVTNAVTLSTDNTIEGINITGTGSVNGIASSGSVGTFTMSDVAVTTASGTGISFTNGGVVTATTIAGANSISSGTGTALDVTNTNIGAGNLTFKSISAGTVAGSSGDGIILDGTGTGGTNGGLHVTGTGATAGSGGTIEHKTGADGSTSGGIGIYLNNTKDVQLADMQLNNFDNYAIKGSNVTGFTLSNSTINGTSGSTALNNSLATPEGSVHFDNLLGSASITNSSISGGATNNLYVQNTGGTLDRLTMTGDTFGFLNSALTNNGQEQDNVFVNATGNGTTLNVTFGGDGVGQGNTILGSIAQLLAISASPANPGQTITMDDVIRHNTFQNGETTITGGGNVNLQAGSNGGTTNSTFDISDNAITGGQAAAFLVAHDNTAGTMSGTIAGNTISDTGDNGDGIFVRESGSGTLTTLIQDNTITGASDNGIALQNNSGSAVMNATLYGNSVTSPSGGFPFAALDVENGATASDTSTTNVVVGAGLGGTGSKNTLTDNALYIIDVELSNNNIHSQLNLSKNGSTATDAQGVISADNNGSPNVDTTGGNGPVTLVGTLPALPAVVLPLLAASGGVQASTPTTGEMNLTQTELDSVVAAAIGEWAAAGASASQLAMLHATTFSIADLSGNTIGDETSPAHITIDTDAAGNGWFIDTTPNDNFEFSHALNAAGTDLLTDPSSDAAGHMDLLTTVTHEMGHVLGLPDSTAASDVNDLMYINLVDGERRLPDAADVTQANANVVAQAYASKAQTNEAALPVSAQPASGTPIVVGTSGNDTIDAGHGGAILFGGAGADNFVFGPSIQPNAPTPPPLTHVADYSAAEGDTFDFSALTAQFHSSTVNDAMLVRAVEDSSGTFATLQLNTNAAATNTVTTGGFGGGIGGAIAGPQNAAANWVSIAQLDGVHSGDAVDVLVDSHAAIHLAQVHAGVLV